MISNARRKAARRRTLDVVRQAFAYRGERAVDVAAEILGAGQDQEGNPNGEDGVLDRGDRGLVAQEVAEHREGLSLGRYWVVRVDGGRGSLICGKGEYPSMAVIVATKGPQVKIKVEMCPQTGYVFGMKTKPSKTDLVKIRLTPAEKEGFQEAARIAGASFSTWARLMLRRAAIREFQDAGRPIDFARPAESAAHARIDNV